MGAWRKSNASFWYGGVLIAGFWVETSNSASRRICYRDPSARADGSGSPAWAMTPIADFGRTVSAGGAEMARQNTEFCGMPWFSGGGYILFHLISKWYLVPSSKWQYPKGLPYTKLLQDGTYDTSGMSWNESGDFDLWAKPGTQCSFAGAGVDLPAAVTVTVTAPHIMAKSDGFNTRDVGEYAGGHWLGALRWSSDQGYIYLVAGTWIGATEQDGALVLGGDARYEASSWARGADIVFTYAGEDVEEHPDITYGWDGYRDLPDDEIDGWPAVERGLAEVAIWR